MIERIEIAGCASYGSETEEMLDLSSVNFVYGANGAGKTTISRLIDDASPYSNCAVHWRDGVRMEPMVYNRDFVHANFNASKDLKGIFTLGQKDIEAQREIAAAKEKIEQLSNKLIGLNHNLSGSDGTGGEQAKLENVEISFRDECWKVKTRHDAKFQGALVGYRNDKQKFRERLLEECSKARTEVLQQLDLEKRASSVFGPAQTSIQLLALVDETAFLGCEHNPILKTRIIGKSDVDIAAMILRLGNSDWVKEGMAFFDTNDEHCPFCQQVAPGTLEASLTEYFDETFLRYTNDLIFLKNLYKLQGEKIQVAIQLAIDSACRFLDVEKLRSAKTIFDSRFLLNKQLVDNKVKEPSQIVSLESLAEILAFVVFLINTANTGIRDHNMMVANLASEKQRLSKQVWAFLAHTEIMPVFCDYQKKRAGLDKAVTALTLQIKETEKQRREEETRIRALEKTATSIEPTVDDINGILKSFGFANFTIQSANGNLYRLCRNDGSDARNTLSEGEKSFLTFLYFYHLLKGSKTESGMNNDRIVVFDDPVPSLDSDVMFVVSSLIRHILDEVRSGATSIKQVFVLTHNVYFHKEFTFNADRSGGHALKGETFWMIRKVGGVSRVRKYPMNPIRTSYDLLWSEVRAVNPTSHTIQNTLRRILEHCFQILGGISFADILRLFEGEESVICKSLLTWVHDGSHAVSDDIFVALDTSMVERYLAVFRKVFVNLGHINHYNMMMGGLPIIETVSAVSPEAPWRNQERGASR